MQEFRTDRGEIRGTVLWLATEVDREFWRLLDTLSRYSYGDEGVTHDDLMLRLDIFWSQFNNFRSGEVGSRLITVARAGETVAAIDATLTAMEPELKALQHGDAGTGMELRDRLAVYGTPIHQISQRVDKSEQQYFVDISNQTGRTLRNLTVFLLCMSASGAVLIVLLMRETRRANRMYVLSSDAERRVREANETLEQRIRQRTAELETEILDRKRIEKELRASDERYALAVSGTADGLWQWNFQTGEDYLSPRWKEIAGYEDHEIENRMETFTDTVHADDRDRVAEAIRAHLERRVPFDLEFRLRCKDGSHVWVRAKAQAVWDDEGAPVRMAGSISDISERKRAEEALRESEERLRQAQKMEAVGQLTGGVAHDFNNLLAIIMGNLDMMAERQPAESPQHNLILSAQRAATRGAELTQHLLAFSRKQVLNPEVVNANSLISDIMGLLRRTLQEDIEIETVIGAGLWNCEVDPAQLENALVNLAINARDAMPDGGKLTIEIANARLDDDYAAAQTGVAPGQYVMVAVTDTGTGMPEEIRERIFEPFFTTKPAGVGSGLGLSMVYGFVRQSGGHVAIYSEEGEGTTIKLYLPRSIGTEAPVKKPASDELPVARGETVLVVEDDPDLRTLTVALLSSLGYQVMEAPTGAAALDRLASMKGVDLLLTDVVLAGDMNGRKLSEKAREHVPEIKVLYMSGYTVNAIVHHGRLDADAELLQKPFRKADLARAVRRVLDGDRPGGVATAPASS